MSKKTSKTPALKEKLAQLRESPEELAATIQRLRQELVVRFNLSEDRSKLSDTVLYDAVKDHTATYSKQLQADALELVNDINDLETKLIQTQKAHGAATRPPAKTPTPTPASPRDPLFDQAVDVFKVEMSGSPSLLQRRLEVGYERASRLFDQLADAGIITKSKDNPNHGRYTRTADTPPGKIPVVDKPKPTPVGYDRPPRMGGRGTDPILSPNTTIPASQWRRRGEPPTRQPFFMREDNINAGRGMVTSTRRLKDWQSKVAAIKTAPDDEPSPASSKAKAENVAAMLDETEMSPERLKLALTEAKKSGLYKQIKKDILAKYGSAEVSHALQDTHGDVLSSNKITTTTAEMVEAVRQELRIPKEGTAEEDKWFDKYESTIRREGRKRAQTKKKAAEAASADRAVPSAKGPLKATPVGGRDNPLPISERPPGRVPNEINPGLLRWQSKDKIATVGKIPTQTLERLAKEGKATIGQLIALAVNNGRYDSLENARAALDGYVATAMKEGPDYRSKINAIAQQVPTAGAGQQLRAGGLGGVENPLFNAAGNAETRVLDGSMRGDVSIPQKTYAELYPKLHEFNQATGTYDPIPLLTDAQKAAYRSWVDATNRSIPGFVERMADRGFPSVLAVPETLLDEQLIKEEAERIRQSLAEQSKMDAVRMGGGGGGGGRGGGGVKAGWSPDNVILPKKMQEAFNVKTLGELQKVVPYSLWDTGLQNAHDSMLHDLGTKPYTEWLAGFYEGQRKLPHGQIYGITPEGMDAAKRVMGGPGREQVRLAEHTVTQTNLTRLSNQLDSLAGRLPAIPETAADRNTLAQLKVKVDHLSTVLGGHPDLHADKVKQVTRMAKKLEARFSKPAAKYTAGSLDALKARVAEIAEFGESLGTATVEQIGKRTERAVNLMTAGKHAEAGAVMGTAEGAAPGIWQDAMNSELGQFLQNHPDKAVRKLVDPFRRAAATSIGAGKNPTLPGRIGALAARHGGGKAVGASVAMGLALPLLLTAWQKLRDSTENARQQKLMEMEQQAAPSAEDLLARYRAQKFVEQGVNHTAPSPEMMKRYQQMMPQLTKSEVYIGPDQTRESLATMFDKSRGGF